MGDLPEKVGAGFLFVSGGSALLLKRSSKHNDQAWGLPGGNMEPQDQGDLLAVATREGMEELGHLPLPHKVLGSLLTRRGKREQKHFTVFVAEVAEEVRQRYQPRLDTREHSEWAWLPLQAIAAQAGGKTVMASSPALQGTCQGRVMHPVVAKAFSAHREALLQMLGVRADGQAYDRSSNACHQ